METNNDEYTFNLSIYGKFSNGEPSYTHDITCSSLKEAIKMFRSMCITFESLTTLGVPITVKESDTQESLSVLNPKTGRVIIIIAVTKMVTEIIGKQKTK